ncbi:MAG: arginase [Alistipes sp.]|nr:arginase [Alistipes sp.]
MKINIIGACQTLGCGRDGVQYGPNSLRNHGLIDRLQQYNFEIFDSGNIYNDENIICSSNKNLKNVEKISDFCQRLANTIYSSLNNGHFPLVLGGDHSIGIGSVCGASNALKGDDLCVIWIDAHTDINTQETTPTGNIHGMTLASVLGLGDDKLSSICGTGAKIKPENIIYIASRDIDDGEADIIRENNITVFHMNEILAEGEDKIIERIDNHINSLAVSSIYLSIDIDVIDPKLAPGTGVPVPNGIDKNLLFKFIDTIARTKKIKGAELVEVNPTIDDTNNTTTLLAIDILDYLINRIKEYTNKAK